MHTVTHLSFIEHVLKKYTCDRSVFFCQYCLVARKEIFSPILMRKNSQSPYYSQPWHQLGSGVNLQLYFLLTLFTTLWVSFPQGCKSHEKCIDIISHNVYTATQYPESAIRMDLNSFSVGCISHEQRSAPSHSVGSLVRVLEYVFETAAMYYLERNFTWPYSSPFPDS